MDDKDLKKKEAKVKQAQYNYEDEMANFEDDCCSECSYYMILES
jgi:hypothetical protein